MNQLIDNIISCKNIKKCLNGEKNNPCYEIVNSQDQANEFQLPEPWNGDVINSKVMFLSSNASINLLEEYPDNSWEKDHIYDFYHNRFNGQVKKWVKDNKFVLLKNGEYDTKYVRFWSSINARSKEIYNRNEIFFGKDFSMVEIVKCKSKDEIGVRKALDECASYLPEILKISNAKVIICLGAVVKKKFIQMYSLQDNERYLENINIEGKNRTIVFLPHPNSRGFKKSLEDNIEKTNLDKIMGLLK